MPKTNAILQSSLVQKLSLDKAVNAVNHHQPVGACPTTA